MTVAGETQLELSIEPAERVIVDAARAFGEAYRDLHRADSGRVVEATVALDRCLFELLIALGLPLDDAGELVEVVEVEVEDGRL